MHTECNIECAISKLLLHIRVGAATFGFIEDDKLNVRYIGQERGFGFADNPGNFGIGPAILDTTNNSEGMTCVTDRRETYDTNSFRLYL